MGITFNADEIFEMAEQIERNGANFYRSAGQKLPQVRQMLLELAAMEDEHEKTFAAMRSALTEREKQPDVFDPQGEVQMYLRAIADGHIFEINADPAEKLKGQDEARDVLKMAIGMEKDSIAFYAGLRESVRAKAGKDKVEAIIREEFGHIATLSEKLAALK